MKDNLLSFMEEYNKKNIKQLHMPGHKRNLQLAPYLKKLGGEFDYTEINNFDDLHCPEGILKQMEEKAVKLWHTKSSHIAVNGSTCGILAAVGSVVKYGDTVLLARNCHKSVYHAAQLFGLNTEYVLPPFDKASGIYAAVQPHSIEAALKKNNKIKLVILTSPTYEGVISDIKGICKIAHKYGAAVIVDEAHGSHLGLSEYFTGSAAKSGCADVVVQSLHKTLPCLTQTAVIHLPQNSMVSDRKIMQQLDIFETSSPSYVIMAAADCCMDLLNNQGKDLFERWNKLLDDFDKSILNLKNIKVICHGSDSLKNHKDFFGFDKSKIIISTVGGCTSLTGKQLGNILRTEYNIEPEMCSLQYALAMTGLTENGESIKAAIKAIIDIDKKYGTKNPDNNENNLFAFPLLLPPQKTNIAQATASSLCSEVKAENALGEISGEYIWAYPPGIPLIAPGETVTKELLQGMDNYKRCNIDLIHTVSANKNNIAII